MSSSVGSRVGEDPVSFAFQCSQCSTTEIKLRDCSLCFFEKYCSVECQTAHWPQHKTVCKLMRSSVQSWPSRQENSQEAGNLFAVRCTKIFPLLVSHFKSNVEEKLALDLGCGPGHSTFFLLERGWKVIAVERNQLSYDALLKAASKTHEQYLKAGKLVVQREDIENYPFDQRFDLIVVNDVFPYLNPKNTLSLMGKIYSALNPGGYLAGTFFQLGGMATFAWSGWGAWFVPSREFVNHVLGKFSYRNVLCRNRPKEGGSAILEFSGQK